MLVLYSDLLLPLAMYLGFSLGDVRIIMIAVVFSEFPSMHGDVRTAQCQVFIQIKTNNPKVR